VKEAAFEGGVAAGMCLSNEPGYYEEGAFGVRIENLVVVVPAPPPAAGHAPAGARPWLAFDNLTLVPMCRALTDAALLSREERAYLDGAGSLVDEILERTDKILVKEEVQHGSR
jgi:Xaa-Pro aminopeptidase